MTGSPPPSTRPGGVVEPHPVTSRAPAGWTVLTRTGGAGQLHQTPLEPGSDHQVSLNQITAPALVLGSSQDRSVVDLAAADRAGYEVCQRRSGGGIVVLRPQADTWIDLTIPPHSPLWSSDVGRAFHWLGRVWAETLSTLIGPGPAVSVHTGALQGGRAGRLVCFASLGPGEVTVDGSKVVGISQRRSAAGARFQSVATWHWEAGVLAATVAQHHWTAADLAPDQVRAGHWPGPGPTPSPDRVLETLVPRLPAVG